MELNTSLSLGLTSGPAPGFDGVILAVSFFPTMIGITGAAIFVVMGIALKSVLMPIRALFAVGLTLVFSYGSAALVYEWGVLNWLGVGSLHTVAGDRSLLWMPPLVSFCMLCGLCLDYELFLVLRIAHYRRVIGLSHRSAIVQGLSSTGPVVTAAGCIHGCRFLLQLVLCDDGAQPAVVLLGDGRALRHVHRAHAACAVHDVVARRRRVVACQVAADVVDDTERLNRLLSISRRAGGRSPLHARLSSASP